MKFGIILEANVLRDGWPSFLEPPQCGEWDQTEGDESWDYNYLAEESEPDDPASSPWYNGHHRKWCALLDKDEFLAFIDEWCLSFEADTMGALGGPTPDGYTLGWMPALAFGLSDTDCWVSAYVTPYPEPVRAREGGFTERDWDRVARILRAM